MPEPATVCTCVIRYIQAARVEEKKSDDTIMSYQNRLRIFRDWIGPDIHIEQITLPVLYDFLYHLNSRKSKHSDGPICSTTVRQYFNALSAMGNWLVRTGRWKGNIVQEVHLPPRSTPERRTIPDRTATELITCTHRIHPPRRSAMAAIVVRLLCYTGIRRSELLSMHASDISLRNGTISIRHGKGDKPRILGLHPEVRSAYIAWMKLRGNADVKHLLTIDRHRRLGDEGLRQLLREIETVAGHAGERITCHPLRHNYATYSHFEAHLPLKVTQQSMGHSRLSTTEIYIQDRPEEVIRSMKSLPVRGSHQSPSRRRYDLRR